MLNSSTMAGPLDEASPEPDDPGPSAPHEVAAALVEAAGGARTIAVTVALPLCSDGSTIRFGVAELDPFDEKSLLSLPSELSPAAYRDLVFAAELAEQLEKLRPSVPVVFSVSAFDSKMVHGLGAARVKEIEDEVTHDLVNLLPEPGHDLAARAPHLQIAFSLRYRRAGDRFVDRMRSLVRPPVPSVPTGQALDLFERTGAVMLSQDPDEPTAGEGMGSILVSTPNTLDGDSPHPLHGRSAVQRAAGAISLTNQFGNYICEVTSLGRLIAVVDGAREVDSDKPVIAYSILNVCDPGNHKMNRMTWSAGEVLDVFGPHVGQAPWAGSDHQFWARVSTEDSGVEFDSREDSRRRREFLAGLQKKITKKPEQRAELISGKIESMRRRVQNNDPDGQDVVLLSGPGDHLRGAGKAGTGTSS